MTTNGLNVVTATTTEQFQSLRDEWDGLLSRSPSANPFLTWEWLFSWWEVYGERDELRLITVRDEQGQLVGLAPLRVSTRRIGCVVPVRKLEFVASGEACSDYLDFIIDDRRRQSALDAILGHLEKTKDDWDVAEFEDMPSPSPLIPALQARALRNGHHVSLQEGNVCPYVELPSSWEEYLASRSKNFRNQVSRKRRKLEREYSTDYLLVTDRDELEAMMGHHIRLHQTRWDGRGDLGTGAYFSSKFAGFHTKVAERFFDRGWLRFLFLRIDGEPVASQYDISYNGTLYFCLPGMDRRWAPMSVGLVLLSECVRRAIEEGLGELDFLRGESDYKLRWASGQRVNMKLSITRRHLKNRLLRMSRLAWHSSKAVAKRLLPTEAAMLLRRKIRQAT